MASVVEQRVMFSFCNLSLKSKRLALVAFDFSWTKLDKMSIIFTIINNDSFFFQPITLFINFNQANPQAFVFDCVGDRGSFSFASLVSPSAKWKFFELCNSAMSNSIYGQ